MPQATAAARRCPPQNAAGHQQRYRDQSVKAWSGPAKKPDRPDPAKGNRPPGRSAKLLAPGYRHAGPPAPRTTESRTARAIRTKSPFAKRAPGDGRPVGAIAVTPGDRRQGQGASK